jgi:hypothetical protein
VTDDHPPIDHQAEALENLRAATNTGGYPQDGAPRTMAGLLTAAVHAILDVGVQLRANAPVPLESLASEGLVQPFMLHRGHEGSVHTEPSAECQLPDCLHPADPAVPDA